MCGILFVLSPSDDTNFVERLHLLKKRGPDEFKIEYNESYICGFTRLCITSPMNGSQPMQNEEWIVVHNGEIYNEEAKTGMSDSYYILDMLSEHDPEDLPIYLDGIFGYCAYHKPSGRFYAARDSIGVIPLYWAIDKHKSIWVSSELKALHGFNAQIVPPGYILNEHGNLQCFKTEYPQSLPTTKHKYGHMIALMSRSIRKRMDTDVPWGILLSGGLDSSIIGTIIQDIVDESNASWKDIHTFSIGLQNSIDLKYAKEMSIEMNSTVHHNVVFTVQDGIDVLRDVIYAIETYDVTTIRASIPMYLLGKYIKKCGIKMVFSGEGADELFGGYLYNKFCPSPEEMHAECITKMERLHYHDCLRANKSLACHGIECRVPFLDRDVVNYAMRTLDPQEKITTPTKLLLRKDFAMVLPKTIAYREKEQFSDGVGDEWILGLKRYARICCPSIEDAEKRFPFQTPKSREAYLYRSIFDEFFGKKGEETVFYTDKSSACSSERGMTWNENLVNDPSAKQIKYL